MIPKSLSASSILVSEACMERWKVENFWRTPQFSSDPADTGTSVHFALEQFVKAVYLEDRTTWDDIKYLNDMYQLGYIETFNSTNIDTDTYRDGAALVAKWYDRNKQGLPNKVLSCEIKENFELKTSAGLIPFNFIWDRCDQLDEHVYEVVDYKTIRAPIRPEDLRQKIQPRAYALAAQIKWPDAEKIWVTFDMLRHDPVGVVFTRDDNAATWRYLKKAAERIIAIDEDDTEERLNAECKWCIKKATCDTLLKASAGGSPIGLTVDELAKRKFEISNAMLALKYADDELDTLLCREAEERDEFSFELENDLKVSVTASKRRKPNSSAIAHIVGPVLSGKYGNFTMTQIDKMLKSGELSPEQMKAVQNEITLTWSSPSAKVTSTTSLDEK